MELIEQLTERELDKLKTTHNRHELLKEDVMGWVVSIESEILKATRNYFDSFGFKEVIVPHITKATGSCENIETLFHVDYFGQKSYLVQTGQLYLESLIPKLGKVFCIGPSFRAEPDIDGRHLTEFTLVELEFPGNFEEVLVHTENIIYSIIQRVLHYKKTELETSGVDTDFLGKIKLPFKRLSYTDAIETLKQIGITIEWGDDLKSTHEKKLVEHFGNNPLFITHFPEKIKFFNMKRNDSNPEVVNSADLILPHSGEAVGAAEREHKHDKIYERLVNSTMFKLLQSKGGDIEDFQWYLEHTKKNGIPHAGCGIGLNRVTQFILGIDDVRASTAFPMNKESLM
ncbi:amino acid--tRNA ligase-related protein [Candidatus Aenigmatarchaeota archaeon]